MIVAFSRSSPGRCNAGAGAGSDFSCRSPFPPPCAWRSSPRRQPTALPLPCRRAARRRRRDNRVVVEFKGVEDRCSKTCGRSRACTGCRARRTLDAEMIGRLAQRAPEEARDGAPAIRLLRAEGRDRAHAGSRRRWRAIVTIEPGSPVMLVEQQVEITGPGRDEPFLQRSARALAAAHRRAPEPPGLRPAEGRAAARRARQRLSRRAVHARASCRSTRPRARRAPALTLETGERYRFGPDDDRAERRARRTGAALSPLPGGRLVQRGGAAAHAVRARRLAVLLAVGSPARRSATASAGRARPHHVRAEQAPRLHDRRRLRDGHRRARHARLGRPPPERPRPSLARPAACLRHRGLRRA